MIMVQIKQKRGIRVENLSPRRFSDGLSRVICTIESRYIYKSYLSRVIRTIESRYILSILVTYSL